MRRISQHLWCRSRLATSAAFAPAKKLELRSGDVVVMRGAARRIFHGVEKIYPETSDLLPGGGRINLTLLRVTRL